MALGLSPAHVAGVVLSPAPVAAADDVAVPPPPPPALPEDPS